MADTIPAQAQPQPASPQAAASPALSDQPLPQSMLENPIVRQLAVMVGIAASVAIGVAVVLWSQTPSYSMLYGSLPQDSVTEVMDALQQSAIDYRIDEQTGAVLVATESLHQARMQLASLGLPKDNSFGFELLQQDNGFGTSRTIQAARYQRSLEGEIARSISTLANVESARVHLATPKQSVFVRAKKFPSASVVLKLYSGRNLEPGQIDAIVHLVASSVPELMPGKVTLVDHKGNLLSDKPGSDMVSRSNKEFEYIRNLERHFKQRVEDILLPLLGSERVRAEVTADVDFTQTEQTQELFNPDQPALRSEQTAEQASRLDGVQGVPGALTNQPPAAGNAPEVADGQGGDGQQGGPLNTSKQATRNFELDRTISHSRLSSGNLKRLSVAVVVDDRVVPGDEEGTLVRVPRSQEEMTRIESLVREAIGYSDRRGDSVRVINAAFQDPLPMDDLPEIPIWEEPWFWDMMRQIGGILLVILLVFGVLRPTMKRLTSPVTLEGEEGLAAEGAAGAAGGVAGAGGEGGIGGADDSMRLLEDETVKLTGPMKYENVLDAARKLVQEDPKRVAQVVRKWIAEENG